MAQVFKSYKIEKHGITLWFNWVEEEGQLHLFSYAALLADRDQKKGSLLKQKLREDCDLGLS